MRASRAGTAARRSSQQAPGNGQLGDGASRGDVEAVGGAASDGHFSDLKIDEGVGRDLRGRRTARFPRQARRSFPAT